MRILVFWALFLPKRCLDTAGSSSAGAMWGKIRVPQTQIELETVEWLFKLATKATFLKL